MTALSSQSLQSDGTRPSNVDDIDISSHPGKVVELRDDESPKAVQLCLDRNERVECVKKGPPGVSEDAVRHGPDCRR